jgi:hypothetical protein
MEENQKMKKWEVIPYGNICSRSILILGTGFFFNSSQNVY